MVKSKANNDSRVGASVAPRPRSWERLVEEYPAVAAAYEQLADAARGAGPLAPETVALLKVAVSVGAGAWRTVHAHAKKALQQGADPDVLRQVALIALPTLGLPAALDALRWIEESITECAAVSPSQPRSSGSSPARRGIRRRRS